MLNKEINLNIERNIVLTSVNDIDQICSPLRGLGITYFSYVKSFTDGSHIRLANNPHWTKYYYDMGFYNVVLSQVPREKAGHILWKNINPYPLFSDASELFDVDNGVVIVDTNDGITERFFFGSTKENYSINNMYIYNIEVLHRFILYFLYQGRSLIDEAEKKHKIYVSLRSTKKENKEIINYSECKEFYENTRFQKYCINVGSKKYFVGRRAAQIIALMKKGITTSEDLSDQLGVTSRSVEVYIENIKDKLNVYSKKDIIKLSFNNQFISTSLFNDLKD